MDFSRSLARVRVVFWLIALTIGLVAPHTGAAAPPGLVALYQFSEGSGAVVRDRSGVGAPLDLRIEDTSATRWLPGGGLELIKPTLVASGGAAGKISAAVQGSGEITIEAWVQPASTGQSGPARIVTLSSGTRTRNFTLGQDGSAYDVRLRTTDTGSNGSKPSVTTSAGSLDTRLTHVVYTRDASGDAVLYLNGRKQVRRTVSGDVGNWDSDYRFALGNELGGNRPWLGALHRVAIYARALDSTQVSASYAAGAQAESGTAVSDAGDTGTADSGSGTGDSDTGGATSSDSTAPAGDATVVTGSATLSWKPPVTRTDGDPLAVSEIAGYSLYYGATRGSYSSSIRIEDSSTTSITVTDLPAGTYYFAVTARDTSGQESGLSTPVSRVVD